MLRLTISVNKHLALAFDQLIERKGYRNRSEAFRDLLRKALKQEAIAKESDQECVACVSYVYDNQQRQLAHRLNELRSQAANATVSVTVAPVNDVASIETLILRGDIGTVVKLAEAIVSETGVRHGHLNVVPLEPEPGPSA